MFLIGRFGSGLFIVFQMCVDVLWIHGYVPRGSVNRCSQMYLYACSISILNLVVLKKDVSTFILFGKGDMHWRFFLHAVIINSFSLS